MRKTRVVVAQPVRLQNIDQVKGRAACVAFTERNTSSKLPLPDESVRALISSLSDAATTVRQQDGLMPMDCGLLEAGLNTRDCVLRKPPTKWRPHALVQSIAMLNAAVKYDWSLEGQPAATAAAADADAEDHVVVGCYYVGRRKTTVAFFYNCVTNQQPEF